jgi:hypothetical protein
MKFIRDVMYLCKSKLFETTQEAGGVITGIRPGLHHMNSKNLVAKCISGCISTWTNEDT